jgi:hypothetical protein
LTFTLSPTVPTSILGDQFRLEHVLGNLLSNAIKFSDIGSKIDISVTYETKVKNYITFSVRDYGCGMTAEDQKLLFQPFMQIRPGELQKGRGSGLGLSICKMLITLHNGTIGCVSQYRSETADPNTAGSEFFFSIEYLPPSPSDSSDSYDTDSTTTIQQSSAGKTMAVNKQSTYQENDRSAIIPDTIPIDVAKVVDFTPSVASMNLAISHRRVQSATAVLLSSAASKALQRAKENVSTHPVITRCSKLDDDQEKANAIISAPNTSAVNVSSDLPMTATKPLNILVVDGKYCNDIAFPCFIHYKLIIQS